jgi:hypothetical protein
VQISRAPRAHAFVRMLVEPHQAGLINRLPAAVALHSLRALDRRAHSRRHPASLTQRKTLAIQRRNCNLR